MEREFLRKTQDGGRVFYHNTRRTLHSPQSTVSKESHIFAIILFVPVLTIQCRLVSKMFKLRALRFMGKCISRHRFFPTKNCAHLKLSL